LARSLFLPTAIRGTILYFVISKLCLIEPMYEFSLGYVKKLYQTGLEKAEFNSMIELKIRRLNESITKIMFTSISRSLFEAHKKLYSFLICCAIKRDGKLISAKEWNFFSRGSGIKPKGFKDLLPNPPAITPNNWYYLHKLTELKGL
jgi:dynein heavy chain